MRETGSIRNPNGDDSITISGTRDEMDDVRRMLTGTTWLRVKDGGVLGVMGYAEPPPPEKDPMIPPIYAIGASEEEGPIEFSVAPALDPAEGWCSPAVYISHLCGYNWTPENYAHQARKLMLLGFECLRSRRGRAGQFWEVWYLPYLEAADGDLKRIVDGLKGETWQKKTNAVVSWCCNNLSFGCLNVSVQRAAVAVD